VATLKEEVDSAITALWLHEWNVSKVQDGNTDVPDPDAMGYSDAKKINATYLYTDMVDSSTLTRVATPEEAALVTSTFLTIAVRVIRKGEGHIRSFDGDRVMGIFAGPDRQDRAVRAALKINLAIDHMLDDDVRLKVPALAEAGWHVRSMTGIASGEALLVRAGVRNNSDMISIGIAPNLAAKLSDLRDMKGSRIAIGKGTFGSLSDANLYSKGEIMWAGKYTLDMGGRPYAYYRSSYHQTEL